MPRYRDRGTYTAPARVTEPRARSAAEPLNEADRRESLTWGYMLGALALRGKDGALPVVGEGAREEMIEGLRRAAEGG